MVLLVYVLCHTVDFEPSLHQLDFFLVYGDNIIISSVDVASSPGSTLSDVF